MSKSELEKFGEAAKEEAKGWVKAVAETFLPSSKKDDEEKTITLKENEEIVIRKKS